MLTLSYSDNPQQNDHPDLAMSYKTLKWFLVSTTVCQEANVILSIVMLLTVKVFSVLFFQNSFSIHLSARKRPQVKGKKFHSIEEKMAPPNHHCWASRQPRRQSSLQPKTDWLDAGEMLSQDLQLKCK